MLLYDSFLSLNAPTLLTGFHETVLKRSDLDFAMKKAVAHYRCLADSSKIAAYKRFLACCEQVLEGQNDVPLLDVVINYLSEADAINEQDACEKLTRIFCLCFQHQEEALGIASMGIFFVDRPIAFAAFLHYLLQREVTPHQILSTHLLQNYFRYYLSSLSQVNNSIDKLYQLVRTSQKGAALCEKVTHVCSEERGFSSYALDGSMQRNTAQLERVVFIDTPLQFTPNESHLKTLHLVFDEYFLKAALYQWSQQKNNVVWVKTMTHLFNQSHVVIKQLPLVVEGLHEQPLLQKALAEILNEQSLSMLVERHVVGILSLIPFCPKLVDMVQLHDLSTYFKAVQQQNTSGPAVFSSLYALFNHVKNTNIPIALLVFDALLDAVHIDPYVLEDEVMIGKLRKFSHVNVCINQKVRALEAELDSIIQLQTQVSIDAMDYLLIEDTWRAVATKMRHLEEIASFSTFFPMDKYALSIQLARAFLQQEAIEFDVQHFLNALGTEPLLDLLNVTPYERLLVELLTAIDNEKVRIHCVQLLDANIPLKWREFNYNGLYLFKKASLAGNLGLIQWMEASNIKNQYSPDSLAMVAGYSNQWSVASYFHVRYSLKQGTINQLYQLANAQRSLHLIPALWSGERAMPAMMIIENQFKLSVQLNDLEGVRCVIYCPNKPSQNAIKNAFNNAITRKYFDMVTLISEGFSGDKLRGAIHQKFNNAARLNQCDVLNVLCVLNHNRPSSAVMEHALISAIRAKHLPAIKQLIRFSDKLLCPKIIQKARDEACKRAFTDISDYLSMLADVINGSDTDYVKKNKVLKRTASLMIQSNDDAVDSKELSIKHAVSCETITALQQQGFFRIKTSPLSPKAKDWSVDIGQKPIYLR